jgi:uncharacterized protein (TIGR02147 family)
METIYCYTDYRAFLRDAYAQAKNDIPAFSYRYFSRKAGFASPNFLKLVIEGKRNLSTESIPKFAQVFKLQRRARRFFEVLVLFNQAKDPDEQQLYYQQLLEFPEYCHAQELAQEQYEYLSHWYYPVVQDLVVLQDFEEDYQWISHKLGREVSPAQARKAIECLCRLGLLQRDADGLLKQAQQHVTTGDVVRGTAGYAYHQQMMDRAKTALHTQSPEKWEYGALTLAVNKKQLKLLKHAIRDFRKVVLNLTSQKGEISEAVYQLNIQLFGHTDIDDGGAS